MCLLPQQCLEGTDQGHPFFQPPTNLLSRCLLRNHGSHLRPANTSFEFNSLLVSDHELSNPLALFHRGGGHCQLPGQAASAGLLHLPLSGCLFWLQRCGSGGHGPLLPWVGWGEAWGIKWLLKMQNQPGGHTSSRTCWGLPKMYRVTLGPPWKPFWSWRRTRIGPCGSVWPGFYPHTHLCDFLENQSWMRRLNSSRRSVTTWLTSGAWPAPRWQWASTSSKVSLSSRMSLWSLEAFEGPLCLPLVSGFCLSLSLQPLGILLTTLEPSSMPWTKWKQKLFAENRKTFLQSCIFTARDTYLLWKF